MVGGHGGHPPAERVLRWALLASGVLLVAFAGWIVAEATRRIGDPPEVDGRLDAGGAQRPRGGEADSLREAQVASDELQECLRAAGVAHATLALECHPCGDSDDGATRAQVPPR